MKAAFDYLSQIGMEQIHAYEQQLHRQLVDGLQRLSNIHIYNADADGAIGSSTSDSERAMITETAAEVLTLIYSFSQNQDLERAMEYGKAYLEKYAGARELQGWIV